MVRLKYVDTDQVPRIKKVWWYGYGERFRRQMEDSWTYSSRAD